MTTKISRLSPSQVQPNRNLVLWNFFSNLGREQYAIAMENACIWFRSRETLRQVQQQAAHQALIIHEAAAKELRDTSGPADLVTVQSDLMSFYLEGPSQYWQQVATTALQTQIEMMASVNHMFAGKTGESRKWALNNFQAALPASDESFDGKPNGSAGQPLTRIAAQESLTH